MSRKPKSTADSKFYLLTLFVMIVSSLWFKGSMKRAYDLIDHANQVELHLRDVLFKLKDSKNFDTGLGMDEDVISNLFQLGKVKSKRGTRNETGTGMGLILCKDMAERQGGAIEVTSMPGKGTTAKLFLEPSKKASSFPCAEHLYLVFLRHPAISNHK